MSRCDLAVIGGGPAGLVAAIRGQLAGLTVRLFERRSPPIDKACGEGLMPDGVASLGECGLLVTDLGRPFRGIRYIGDGMEATGTFPDCVGVGIRRLKLQASLVDRAAELGVELHWKCAVRGLEQGALHTADGCFQADWIAGADGLHSRVREWLGLRVRRGRPRFGTRRHFEIEPWNELVEVHWGNECEAYVTPIDGDEIGVAVLWSGRKQPFAQLLDRFPRLRSKLANARVRSEERGAGPFWMLPERVMVGRVALIGDAAGYLDPITGEGLSQAFEQAGALVRAIVANEPSIYPELARKPARWRGRLIRSLLFIERRPRLRARLIRTLADEPELFSQILAAHVGGLEQRRLGVLHAGRLLWGLARG